jgi:putative salt-induced outer membrane protein YdiY
MIYLTPPGVRWRFVVLSAFLWACSFGEVALADTLSLHNGDRLSGTLVSVAEEKVIFETTYAGSITVEQRAIQSLETSGVFILRGAAYEQQGALTVLEGQQGVETESGFSALDLASIETADRVRRVIAVLPLDWATRVDLSAVFSSGNSTTESFNTLAESRLKRPQAQHLATLLRNTEKSEGTTSKDQVDLGYGYKRFISPRWFGSANANYFSDELKDIDQRLSVGGGLGFQVLNSRRGVLSTEFGISAVQERFNGVGRINPAARWAIDFQRYFFDRRVEVFHRQSILSIAADERGQVLTSSTGIRFALSDRIDTALRTDLNYETDPPPGNKKADTTYTLGVGLKF